MTDWSKDPFANEIAAVQRAPEAEAILERICAMTGMGFAAIARVTSDRWVACQVLDRIEFGLDPGDELSIKTTICDEIRASGTSVFIDEVATNPDWRTHHTPALYGFESYVSVPIILSDGRFFGTLCAIDPAPRAFPLAPMMAEIEALAATVAAAIERALAHAP